ncbi:endonuclease/exonuclease/phosphatase family protein [Microbacterium sp. NPDC058342]|uniref:endonuclease/exonuclease/phosphatase family protein n=1 Tax=Microbacterium sp. NPDC058342 TaxID=3346454 RepID=UPI003651A4F7
MMAPGASRDETAPNVPARRTGVFFATLIACLVVAVPVTLPQAFRLELVPGFAQVVALRGPLALGFFVIAVLAGLIAALRRRWSLAAGIAIAALVAGAGNAGILWSRSVGAPSLKGDLVVLTWNTQGGATGTGDIAELVHSSGASIVSLPEMDEKAAGEVARLVEELGGPVMFHDTVYGDSTIPTSVLIAESLGDYAWRETAGSTPGLPSGVWEPVDHDGPLIVVAHPYPPLPSGMAHWREGLRWVASWCDEPRVIVAGDLNATVDHLSNLSGMEGCTDAAATTGAGARGTWPSTVASWLASPIDHVLVGRDWAVRGSSVIEETAGGTDHRALVAVLAER